MCYSNYEILVDFNSAPENPLAEKAKLLLKENAEIFTKNVRYYLDKSNSIAADTIIRIPVGYYNIKSEVAGIRIRFLSEEEEKLNFKLEGVELK